MQTTDLDRIAVAHLEPVEDLQDPDRLPRKQQIEQSITRNPAVYVGAAVAAGVVLGCLIKR